MPPTVPAKKKQSPAAFRQHNESRFQRTVRLTRQALAQLQADGQLVTLTALAEATRQFDDRRKGLSPTTILRNPEAALLFRQHSPAYQARQQAAAAKGNDDILKEYPDPGPTDLIRQIEDLKQQVAALKAQCQQLKTERDEALRQNTHQLARLTQLMSQQEERHD